MSILSDHKNIYAAVAGNIVIIDKQTKKIVEKPVAANYIFCLAFDKYARIWAATTAGLDCFAPEGNSYKKLLTVTAESPIPSTISFARMYIEGKPVDSNIDIITSLMNSKPLAQIEIYTTQITYVLDMAIVSPVIFICLYHLSKGTNRIIFGNICIYSLIITSCTSFLWE